MFNIKKALPLILSLLAAALSACSRSGCADHAVTVPEDRGQLTSAAPGEETAAAITEEQTDSALSETAAADGSSAAETETVTETELSQTEENITNAPDPSETVYKEDELLSKRFSQAQINYLHGCAFLGDSTCLGYCRYGLIADARVFGNGGVAARNIHEHTFVQKGQEVDYITALKNTGCKELYFLMGMNDVRIVSADDYKVYYKEMLREVREAIPDANIHILSVTPITEDSDFYPNERLTLLNDKLREISEEEGYAFIDTASAVRNEKGFLTDELCSGDGIHMVPEAYYLMLGVILEYAGV